jgi:hypothetical protein
LLSQRDFSKNQAKDKEDCHGEKSFFCSIHAILKL